MHNMIEILFTRVICTSAVDDTVATTVNQGHLATEAGTGVIVSIIIVLFVATCMIDFNFLYTFNSQCGFYVHKSCWFGSFDLGICKIFWPIYIMQKCTYNSQ